MNLKIKMAAAYLRRIDEETVDNNNNKNYTRTHPTFTPLLRTKSLANRLKKPRHAQTTTLTNGSRSTVELEIRFGVRNETKSTFYLIFLPQTHEQLFFTHFLTTICGEFETINK